MNLHKDAFGQEIWAYFNEKKSFEIIERDDGFIDLSGGAASYFRDFKEWSRHEKKAIKQVKGKILDIGAGAGRVSLYLQQKGFTVTAVDNSPLAIKVCKKRGVKKTKMLSVEKIDLLKPNIFDTVLMFGNNFGLLGSAQKAKILLKKFYNVTSPQAFIIAESNDPYQINDPAHLSYQKFNKKRGRMAGQIKIRVRFEIILAIGLIICLFLVRRWKKSSKVLVGE